MGLFTNNEVKSLWPIIHRLEADYDDIRNQLKEFELKDKYQKNIITAEEAAGRLQQIEEEALPKELNNAFVAIDKALNDEQDSLILFEYTKEYEDKWCTTCNMVRVYHIKRLAEALRKYGYRVDIYDPEDEYGLRIKIHLRDEEDKLESSKIDPDKKYILPMEGTVKAGLPHQTLYAFRVNDTWVTSLETEDAKAIGNMQYVYGKDILSAPDWVKAIKPIEVEE
ncbi:hypothetical protein ACTEYT_10225 (plasmid) [Limosilactobacillus reuteri]|uniref:DUF1642 domain-containing protein n=1 Tax=Limosilactobacillus reuteri subsp. suis (strain ATCC 53608 / LMG 31752 / 1063) TaxID=927703 RepID=F8KGF5_LIMR5|nr:conserved hypothetical protein [Limosilactobacillus reuteri subsp. suis]CUU13518.1 hypothetical protein predicted by prodigal [Limosilactobacillus reuteri subsp. suis]